MATKKRGRKPLDNKEKIVPITIWVKSKNLAAAKTACAAIQTRHR